MTQRTAPTVSIIIATRDRAEVLDQCLEHVQAQDGAPLEVIVVDNSVDQLRTLAVIRRHSDIIYLRADPRKRNPALTRNLGIQASRGEILAFIDDDTLVAPGWLSALVNAFMDPQVGGASGRVVEADAPEVCTPEIGRFTPRGEITMNFNNIIDQSVPIEFLYGCNMALRRSMLLIVGQYDPWFGIMYEETDLSFRIRRTKSQLQFVPGMMVQHLRAPRPSGVVQRSDNIDVRSMYLSCRSLAYLCVSHFGLRRDFARVAFVNLPKGAMRSFVDQPSANRLLKVPTVLVGGLVGYGMAAARGRGIHRPPTLMIQRFEEGIQHS